ncbi:MAG: DUF350 domain-containing protein [Ruminococcus sp.]|jgi:putative membrane protein|nr:DUF350 domain-containing protein [Ruminococcus sp.]
MEKLLAEVLETLLYGGLGLVLMLVGMFVFDLTVPYDFNKELKEKNVGAGFMIAGLFISVAIIVRTVIM